MLSTEGPVNTEYQFFAFISYKRADSIWADWLYRSLQDYRLPSKLCKKYNELPKRLCPVFLDKEDLVPGNLSESLKEHIALSKYFISVCSRNAQKNPQYIDMELRYFLETHDNDYTKVIPFIVEESSAPEKECFSPEMQALCAEHQLIGVNVTERGRHRALLKVVAYMHGLMVSEIESADDIRKRKNAAAIAAAALVCLCSCIFGFTYWWQNVAVHTSYYLGCTWKNNVAVGVGEIRESELSDYSLYYAFETVGGRVISVTHRNYAGTVAPLAAEATVLDYDAARVEFAYIGEGEKYLYTAKYFDYSGLPILCCQYSADGTHVRLLKDEKTGVSAYIPENLGIAEASDLRLDSDSVYVSRLLQEFDENGFAVRRYYAYGEDYAAASDADGVFGYTLAYDENGCLSGVFYFANEQGTLAGETGGISSVLYRRDSFGRVESIRFLDAEGNAVSGTDGWAEKTYAWNENSNVAVKAYFGPDGCPVAVKGYASLVNEYAGTALVRTSYYGIDGEAALAEDGYASVTYKTNEIGEIVSYRYWGIGGEAVTSSADGTYGKDIYKTAEKEQYRVYVDQNGAPMETAEGYAYVYTTKDEFGYPLRSEYRDASNLPCTEHYASCTYEYDPVYHEVTKWCFFDENGEAVVDPEMGCAVVVSEYDSRGFNTLREFRDEKGDLCNVQFGYARVVGSYVLDGTYTVETEMFYGADGEPVIHSTFNAYGYECTRYENGKLAQMCYLDPEGKPYFNEKEGFAGVIYDYDEFGKVKLVSYFGEYGKDILVNGYTSMTYQRDEKGRIIQVLYFGIGKDLWVNEKEGCAAVYYTYENDKLVGIDYYGVEAGELIQAVNPLEGYASVFYNYDEKGELSGVDYYGAENGELVPMVNEAEGYASVRWCEYPEDNTSEETYYGVENGKMVLIVNQVAGYCSKSTVYDENGRIIEVHYFGTDGKYMNHLQDGYAALAVQYDENGEIIAGAKFEAVNGKLVKME